MFEMLLFWLLMVIWLVLGPDWTDRTVRSLGGSLIVWILLALLGLHVFGNPFSK